MPDDSIKITGRWIYEWIPFPERRKRKTDTSKETVQMRINASFSAKIFLCARLCENSIDGAEALVEP